ncbi:MAG: hypothetical protein K2W96_22295 [Gemmataceae bacterium]|nr:hypothetical protein [Gemmataceae bacterium]
MSLLLLALLAAPAPVEPGEDDAWLRAMPDDTDVVAVFDVKRFMDSDLVKKGLGGKLPPLLDDKFLVPIPLKPLGVDPSKDLKQMAVVMGRSLWLDKDGKPASGGGLFVLMRTGKSEASIRGKLAELAKAGTEGFKELPGGKVYEYSGKGPRGAVAVLPGGVLALGENARPLEMALERVKTGKKPAFKHAEMAKFLKSLKPGPLLSMRMLGDAVVSAHSTGRKGPAGGPVQFETKLVTLSESGFEAVTVSATVKETIKGKCELLCKDADLAAKKAKEFDGLRALVLPMLQEQAKGMPALAPVLKAFENAKIGSKDKAVVIEAEIGPDVVKALELAPDR